MPTNQLTGGTEHFALPTTSTPDGLSTSRIENGNRECKFGTEAIASSSHKAADAERGGATAQGQRILAGEGPHAGRRAAVHQNRLRYSLQRGGAFAVDASASALVNERTVKERRAE